MSEPIYMYQRPLPETRTKERPCKWRAEVIIAGKSYVEVSRAGATHELARTLKNAGISDAALMIHDQGRRGTLTVPSFHAWAEWTYAGEKRIPWARAQAALEHLRERGAGASAEASGTREGP